MANPLYGILDDLKTNAVPFISGGAGVVVGLAAGRLAHDFVADWLAPVSKPDTIGADGKPVAATVTAEEAKTFADNRTSAVRLYLAPLIPIVLGIATVVYGRGKVPAVAENAVEGAGLGLAAWGVGKLFTNLTKTDNVQAPWVTKWLPQFAGVGEVRGLAAMYLRRASLQGCGRTTRADGSSYSNCGSAPAVDPAFSKQRFLPQAALPPMTMPMQGVRGYRNSAPATRRSIGAAGII